MNYSGAFEEFLLTYESTISNIDAAATDAFESLNIDEDDLGDEYVMVDNDVNGKGAVPKPGQYGDPKKKYMNMLQQVADREISEVTIALDDLQHVCFPSLRIMPGLLANKRPTV